MLANENPILKEASETVYILSEEEKIRQQCLAREDYYRTQNDLHLYYGRKLEEKDATIAEKDAAIAEKDATIADKDAAIADKDAAIADKDATIAALEAEIAALKDKL